VLSTEEDFDRRTDPFRHELLAHCYRMLGSVHDAEDLVQDTYLRAWRAYPRYDEQRSSIRTWLYRIATNACLTSLTGRGRRPLPSGFVGRSDDPAAPYVHGGEATWLQPFPDARFGDGPADPAAVVYRRGSMRLAFVAAMQLLPARQRATLILRDVLDFSAAESAEILGTTTAAVNSALQRARARLDDTAVLEEQIDEPSEPGVRALIERYIEAFEKADIEALKQLLTDDVLLEMPPMLNWYVGREVYSEFITIRVWSRPGAAWRMLPIAANGQPAVALYLRGGDGVYRPHTLQVFTVTAAGISRNTVYQEAEALAPFGLAATLADDPVGESIPI
jgi:RNA polymerase sigma-70 factor (ECF subfamily)